MAQVTLENVWKVYPGGVEAVKGIDLGIRDEEFIVLVGPSGCGKSTTLRMVAGLEEITDGTVRIGERIVNDVTPKNRDIAMVFQNYALYPHMTVYKNMAFGLKLRRFAKSEIDRRVREAARMLGIEALLDRRSRELSGGQRQRVAVGRAIVRDPACFLFDEPLSNLDAKLRVETRTELKRLHQRLQTTTIYVTHDQEEAMTLGDRVVVMDQGLIQQCDTPMNVYQYPANRFVAGFLGMPPMNFIDGRLTAQGEAVYFEASGMQIRLDPAQAQRLHEHVGAEVVLGIRAEDMYLRACEYADQSDQTLESRLHVVEPLGARMDVYAHTPSDQRIVARVVAEPIEQRDQALRLYLDMSRAHIFAPGDHGANLSLDAERQDEAASAAASVR